MVYPTKNLEDLVDFQGGLWTAKKEPSRVVKVLRNTNFRNGGRLDFSNVAEIEVEEKQLVSRLLERGDLLLERSGGGPTQPVGRVMYFDAGREFSFSNFTTRLRVKNINELDPVFLWRYLNYLYDSGFTERLQKQTTGIRNLIFSEYKEIQILLPPAGEQRRMVERIEDQFKKIDEAVRLRGENEERAAALLPAALHEIFSESKKWEEVHIGDKSIMQMTSGGTPSRSNRSYYSGNHLWLKSGELNDNMQIEDSDEHISDEALKKSSAKIFPAGTVLMAMYGATAGKLGILAKPAATNQAVAGLAPSLKRLDSRFLYYCLLHIRKQIIDQAWGGAQPNLSQTILKTFKIPLPPLAEQKAIAKKLDALSAKVKSLQELQRQQSADLKELKLSIMQKAFALE